MTRPDNQFQELAAQAAERVRESRELAEQLTLLPDERQGTGEAEGGPRRRGPGKATSQIRAYLDARGYRAPEQQLAEMAGLASRDDAITTAMAQAERILAWAAQGAVNRVFKPGVGHVLLDGPWQPTAEQRMETFLAVYATQLRAADALMPYAAPKVTPDGGPTQVNQIIVQGGAPSPEPQAGPQGARDVTPQVRRIRPPPMPGEIVQNQGLGGSQPAGADGRDRTE